MKRADAWADVLCVVASHGSDVASTAVSSIYHHRRPSVECRQQATTVTVERVPQSARLSFDDDAGDLIQNRPFDPHYGELAATSRGPYDHRRRADLNGSIPPHVALASERQRYRVVVATTLGGGDVVSSRQHYAPTTSKHCAVLRSAFFINNYTYVSAYRRVYITCTLRQPRCYDNPVGVDDIALSPGECWSAQRVDTGPWPGWRRRLALPGRQVDIKGDPCRDGVQLRYSPNGVHVC